MYHAASPTSSTSADAADGDGERAGAGGESGKVEIKEYLLWDRKAEGGFPGMIFFSSRCNAWSVWDKGSSEEVDEEERGGGLEG